MPVKAYSTNPHAVYMRAYKARKGDEYIANAAKYGAAYREKAKEKISARQKVYREANKEKIRAYQRESYLKNKAKKSAYDAIYRQTKRAEIASYLRAWNEANRELRAEHSRNRKARVRGAEGKHTAKEVRALFQTQNGQCAFCQKSLYEGFHADHIMPVSRGGSNWIANIQLLCAFCNVSKHDLTPEEYAYRQRSRSSTG